MGTAMRESAPIGIFDANRARPRQPFSDSFGSADGGGDVDMSDLSEAIGDDSIAPTPYATAAMSRSPSSQSYTNIQALGDEAEPMHIDREGVQKKLRVGRGTFGIVYRAEYAAPDGARCVAVKSVPRDPRYQNRELPTLRLLAEQPNRAVVGFLGSYVTMTGEKVVDHLVMEFMPSNLEEYATKLRLAGKRFPCDTALYCVRRVGEGLRHLHALGICHRDLKPQNVLIDTRTKAVKICDLGSAKQLSAEGPAGVTYISSRFYRAPELLLENTCYSHAIDAWALGCIFAELLAHRPLFAARSNIEVLASQFTIKGTPSLAELNSLSSKDAEWPDVPFKSTEPTLPWDQTLGRPEADEVWPDGAECAVHAVLDGLLAWLPQNRTDFLRSMEDAAIPSEIVSVADDPLDD